MCCELHYEVMQPYTVEAGAGAGDGVVESEGEAGGAEASAAATTRADVATSAVMSLTLVLWDMISGGSGGGTVSWL